MHASAADLISIRDGAPVGAGTAEHVASCRECGAALARLIRVRAQLQRLPRFEPPLRSWSAIERRLPKPGTAPGRNTGWRLATAAAAVLAAIVLVLLIGPLPPRPAPSIEPVGGLVARSQQLEAMLNGLPRPVVERAATSAAIDELQARIEVLDLQLSSARESGLSRIQTQDLWSERVRLLNSLVSVRYAEQAARGNRFAVIDTGDI
jgi:hypothetical protein